MEVLPVDLVAIVGIGMSMLVLLIPITGWTVRFAIKPITEAIAKMREGASDRQAFELMERRIALLEQELHGLGGMREDVSRVLEELEFQKQLKSSNQ